MDMEGQGGVELTTPHLTPQQPLPAHEAAARDSTGWRTCAVEATRPPTPPSSPGKSAYSCNFIEAVILCSE